MLRLRPISLRDANEYVRQHHRHHKPVAGHKFSIGCEADGELVGVIIAGRPVSLYLDDGFTLEVEVLYVKEVLQIHIKNSCLPDCQTDNTGKYLTTKKNKDWHGLGMSSIEQTVECYHGEINAENRGTEFEVTVIMYGSIQEK